MIQIWAIFGCSGCLDGYRQFTTENGTSLEQRIWQMALQSLIHKGPSVKGHQRS